MPDTASVDEPGSGFVEVADRCWVARPAPGHVNVGLVGGASGLLMVDTSSSGRAASSVVEHVRSLGAGEVVAIFNTHEHAGHTSGNSVVSQAYGGPRIVAHDAARTLSPTEAFSSARVVDLGDRQVELLHLGRGHTAGDAVARVPDTDVVLVGDLVAGPVRNGPGEGVPGFGDDCFLLEWPATLDLLLSLLGERSVVVPGHGAAGGRAFVDEQSGKVGTVAETVRDLASRGVPVDRALASARWPFPTEHLGRAVGRGYRQLPRSGRRLPIV
jgi:glyoxylase-like metal-dependent hydrolase (beta-lactamase superfamily II)